MCLLSPAEFLKPDSCRTTNALHTKLQNGLWKLGLWINAWMHQRTSAWNAKTCFYWTGSVQSNVTFGTPLLLEEIETALCGVVLGGWHCIMCAITESMVSKWAWQWWHRRTGDDSLVGSDAGQTRSKADLQIGQRLELLSSVLCNLQRKMPHGVHSHIGQVEHATAKHDGCVVTIKADSCYSTNALNVIKQQSWLDTVAPTITAWMHEHVQCS